MVDYLGLERSITKKISVRYLWVLQMSHCVCRKGSWDK